MPRIAVALGMMALLAGSIGLNIVRYPAVWQMVADLPQATQPAPAAVMASAASPAIAPPSHTAAKRPRTNGAVPTARVDKAADDAGRGSPAETDTPRPETWGDANSEHPPGPPQFNLTASDQPQQATAADPPKQSSADDAPKPSTATEHAKSSGSSSGQHGRDKKGPASTASAQAAAKSKKKKDAPPPPDGRWPTEVAQARKPTAGTTPAPSTDQRVGDRPLVPVFYPGLESGSGPADVLDNTVRRLPAVAPPPAGTTTRIVSASYSGPLPPYPSTGVE